MDAKTLASLPPQYLAAMLRDPRLAMSADMQKEGSDTSPVGHPLAALARVIKGGLGGYTSGRAQQDYMSQGEDYNKALAGAIKAMSAGGIDAGLAASADNPLLASDFGKDLAIGKAKSDYEIDKLKAIEIFKSGIDPKNQALAAFLGQYNKQPQGTGATPDPSSPLAAPTAGQGALLPPVPAAQLQPPMSGAQLPAIPPMPPNAAMGSAVNPPAADGLSAFVPPEIQKAVANSPASRGLPSAPQPGAPLDQALGQKPVQPGVPLGGVTNEDAAYNAVMGMAGLKAPEGMIFGPNGMERAPPGMTDVANLRKSYAAEAGDFADVTKNFARLEGLYKAPPSGATDIGMIFSYMKTLDPRSVVREGEQATAQNTGGIPSQVWAMYNRAINGERLSPEVRDNIYKASMALLEGSRGQNKNVEQSYRGIADRYGINQDDIVVDYSKGLGEPKADRVKVIDPQGKPFTIDASEVQEALKNGWRQAQ